MSRLVTRQPIDANHNTTSSGNGPSRKRARVNEDEKTPDLQKDEEVWLSDGNIVVVAANKIAFRVHKSILALQSEVFSDLFSLPGADEATPETMDGCPVVHVSDSPDDIRRLFLVLCCGKKCATPSPDNSVPSFAYPRCPTAITTTATCSLPCRSRSSPRSSAWRTSAPSKTSSTTPSPVSRSTTPAPSPSGRTPAPALATSRQLTTMPQPSSSSRG